MTDDTSEDMTEHECIEIMWQKIEILEYELTEVKVTLTKMIDALFIINYKIKKDEGNE
jgi:hypothetical protein